MYLTWSAMSNNSNRACNPSLLNIISGQGNILPSNVTTSASQTVIKPQVLDGPSIVSLLLWLLMVLYSTFSSASKGNKLINLNGESTAITDSERKLF